jgi:SAM-dependent methyltransferase
MEIKTCNYCESIEQDTIYELTDLLLDRKDFQATLVKCRKCGLVFQNPQPSLKEIEAYYPPEYQPFNAESTMAPKSLLGQLVYRYGIWKRSRQVLKYKTNGRLLDVGCGTGSFLGGMQAYAGWELYGIEPNAPAAKQAQDLFCLNIRACTLEDAGFPSRFFDVITLWDVLEHLHDPTKSLREIHRILHPEGILIMRLPNGDSREAKMFSSNWAGLDAPRHLFIFTPGLRKLILQKTNFQVLDMNSKSGGYSTFLLSLQFWLAAKGTNSIWTKRLMSLFQHPLSRVVFLPFFSIIGMGLQGSELMVIAAKSDFP